jgi:hypothetical protein
LKPGDFTPLGARQGVDVSQTEEAFTERGVRLWRRRLIVLAPLAAFLGLSALFMVRLNSGDPARIPSALIGHPAPLTALPPLPGLTRDGEPVPGIKTAMFGGKMSFVNVWASWVCALPRRGAAAHAARGRPTHPPVVGLVLVIGASPARWSELTPAEWRDGDDQRMAELKATGTARPCPM